MKKGLSDIQKKFNRKRKKFETDYVSKVICQVPWVPCIISMRIYY